MAVEILMPKLGMTMEQGKLVSWSKNEKDSVQKGEIICIIETDKVTFEVESPGTGILLILMGPAENILVGTLMGYLAVSQEEYDKLKQGKTPAAVATPQAASQSEKTPACSPGKAVPVTPLKMNANRKNIVIIGGGPGGYPAAIKAAQLGADVTIIDKDGLGGTCLHKGCIPTKYLLKAARENDTIVKYLKNIDSRVPLVDLKTVMQHKSEVVGKLASGTAMLLNKNGVRVISGTAGFADSKSIRIAETGEVIPFSSAIIATGSESTTLPVEGLDLEGVFDSSRILDLDQVPKRLAVIGGGYIGLEFAQIFHMFGAKVTVIEMMPHLMPGTDPEISTAMQKILGSHGIRIHVNSKLMQIRRNGSELCVRFKNDQTEQEIKVDAVLVAVGRKPRLAGLGLDSIGVRTGSKGAIDVNKFLETSVAGIYAVGDAVGGLMLAHKATAEGECAVLNIVNGPHEMSYAAVPSVMYTYPEMAAVGLTEAEAKDRYGEILVGRFPMAANGRAVLSGALQGFIKVIAEMETEIIVGASFICPEAGHLVGEATLAIQMEATLDDIAETIHAHPTLAEAFREAALDAKGEAIHIPPG